jgi:hypothetical protein
MKKLIYLIVLIAVIVALFFVPNSLLLRPFVNHLKSKMEENWNCKIEDTKTDFDLLKGFISLENLDIKTEKNTNSSWHLKTKSVTVVFDYSSLRKGDVILNEVVLDDVFFEIDKKSDNKAQTELQKNQYETEKGILIKNLLIRGSFEVTSLLDSVLVDSISVKNTKIRKNDVYLGETPEDLLFPLMQEVKRGTKYVIGSHESEIGPKKGGRITLSDEITDPVMEARGLKKGDVFADE